LQNPPSRLVTAKWSKLGIVELSQRLFERVVNQVPSSAFLGLLNDTRLFKHRDVVRMALGVLAKRRVADDDLIRRGPAIVMTANQNYENDGQIPELGNAALLLMQRGRTEDASSRHPNARANVRKENDAKPGRQDDDGLEMEESWT